MSEPPGSIGFSFQAPDKVKMAIIDGVKDENGTDWVVHSPDLSCDLRARAMSCH